jgi:hypothetical protein
VTVAYACGPSLMLLLVGQAVPFLGHLEECGALLSGWEVSSHEMEVTRKPPILFRFARHSGPLGKQRGERSQRSIVPGRPKNALLSKK